MSRKGVSTDGPKDAGTEGAQRLGGGMGLPRRPAPDVPWLACWCRGPASAPSRPHHASRSKATDESPASASELPDPALQTPSDPSSLSGVSGHRKPPILCPPALMPSARPHTLLGISGVGRWGPRGQRQAQMLGPPDRAEREKQKRRDVMGKETGKS